jgi:protein involved in polysaccharide export with SLBB domain
MALTHGCPSVEIPKWAPRTACKAELLALRTCAVWRGPQQLALYMHDYRSRQVAVIGAVSRPGLSSPASEPDPVLEMIALAGGIASEAIAMGPRFAAAPNSVRPIRAGKQRKNSPL